MEPKPSRLKLEAQANEQEQISQQQETKDLPAVHEFSTPEEVLRFDAAQTVVPPTIAERLRRSVASEPAPKQSWWRRWWSGREPEP